MMLGTSVRAFSAAIARHRPSFIHSTFSSSSSEIVNASGAADVAGEDFLLDDAATAAAAAAVAKPEMIPTLLQPRVVVYDGVCHLCHKGVKQVIKADKHRKIKFCCLQSKAAEPYMRVCGVDREDVLRRFLFIEGPDLYHQGSTG